MENTHNYNMKNCGKIESKKYIKNKQAIYSPEKREKNTQIWVFMTLPSSLFDTFAYFLPSISLSSAKQGINTSSKNKIQENQYIRKNQNFTV